MKAPKHRPSMLDLIVQASVDGSRLGPIDPDLQLEAELARSRSAQPELEVEISNEDDLAEAWFNSFDPNQFVAYE